MADVIKDMVMPNGWHYIEDWNPNHPDKGHRIPANGYLHLLDVVFKLRLANQHLPNAKSLATVKQDVDTYICKRYPNQCHNIQGSIYPQQQTQIVSDRYIDKISRWATSMHEKGASNRLVSKIDADKRALSCIQCPFNESWEGQCASCVENARRLLIMIRLGKECDHSKRLNGCKKFNHDNRTAVWIDKELFKTDETAPNVCWLKN